MNVYADEDAIYALFSGRADEAFGRQGSFARFVHVFEWSDALREVWELERAAIAITVDASRRRLLAVVHDPMPGVIAYPLGPEC